MINIINPHMQKIIIYILGFLFGGIGFEDYYPNSILNLFWVTFSLRMKVKSSNTKLGAEI